MVEIGSTNALYFGAQGPGYHDITPSYITKIRKASYCIMMTLEVFVLGYIICH